MTASESPTVLVVDDDPLFRGLLRTMCEIDGWRVTEADDGEHALLAAEDSTPAAVITDLFMPSADGIELIRALRERMPDVPILALSGAAPDVRSSLLAAAALLGAWETSTKVLSFEAMRERLRRLRRYVDEH